MPGHILSGNPFWGHCEFFKGHRQSLNKSDSSCFGNGYGFIHLAKSLHTGEKINLFDFYIGTTVHDLNLEIREMVDNLPFAAFAREIVYVFDADIREMVNNLDFKIGKMFHNLNFAVQFFAIERTVERNIAGAHCRCS